MVRVRAHGPYIIDISRRVRGAPAHRCVPVLFCRIFLTDSLFIWKWLSCCQSRYCCLSESWRSGHNPVFRGSMFEIPVLRRSNCFGRVTRVAVVISTLNISKFRSGCFFLRYDL